MTPDAGSSSRDLVSPKPAARLPAQVKMTYRGHNLCFETDSGVFSRTELDRGTEVLLNALPENVSGTVLDMGCGYGVIGVAVGAQWPACRITMADINQRACGLAQENAMRSGVAAEVLESDGYAKVLGRKFDWILQNPPIRAGKAVIYQMFADAARCLNPEGELWPVPGEKFVYTVAVSGTGYHIENRNASRDVYEGRQYEIGRAHV